MKRIYLICFVFLLAACSETEKGGSRETNANKIKPAFLQNVQTVTTVFAGREEELTLTGKVEYEPEKVIRYIPLIRGTVERTCFSLGDKVRKGQPLLDIRSAELSALLSETIAFESEVEIAQRSLQNAQSLYDDDMLSDKELLEAKAKLRQAQAAFERAENDMSLYEHKGRGVFSILAPISGYIVDKQVASGSPVSSEGAPLFTVADLSRVRITANVYAGDLQLVRENAPVEITALSYPDEVFTGKIDVLSHVFDPEEKILKAGIIMSNQDLKFKPEMSVIVRLKNKKASSRIALPSDALIFDDNKYFVVVEETSGEFKIKQVELAGNYKQTSYIGSGLDENEKVVVKNQLLIYSGLNEK